MFVLSILNNQIHYIDELHIDREHKDVTLDCWIKFNLMKYTNKVLLSYRNRSTHSPFKWVKDLKSFNKIILEYSFYFKNIRFG